jgi:hypothetical protein
MPPRTAPPSLATKVSAEASKGPEQGLQTKPSTAPSNKAPPKVSPFKREDTPLAPLASGIIHWVKRSLSTGTHIITPSAISSTAPNKRTCSLSRPMAGPSAPSTTPMPANDKAMPTPMATGARRLPCAAPPNTMGKMGKTQGDKVVKLPASKLKPR